MVIATYIILGLFAARMLWNMFHPDETTARIEARKERGRQRAAELAAQERIEVEYVTRRPTVTRVAGGMILGGLPGAVLGFAFRKKDKNRIRINRP